MDLGYYFQNQILCQCRHFRPVFDVWSKLDLNGRICHTFAVKDTILINCLVKEVFLSCIFSGILFCGSQEAFVCCCCCNRSGIHKCNGRNLTVLDLGSLSVREVSGSMADTESIVGRCISCTETWSTKCGFNYSTCSKELCQDTIFCKFHINRRTCRINTESESICSNAGSTKDISCCTDILKSATCTSCDDSLLYIKFAIYYFVFKGIWYFTIQADLSFLFYVIQNIIKVGFQFIDGVSIAWMERHCDHWFDFT